MALGDSLDSAVLSHDVGRIAMTTRAQQTWNYINLRLPERARRISRLVEKRLMTATAAALVVDAAMFGLGCVEGEVRARIEAQKNKETNEPNSEGSARSVQGKSN